MKNGVKTAALLAGLGAVLIVIGQLLFGGAGAVIGLAIGVALCGGSYWFSDTLAIKAARAQPVTEAEMPEYYAIVRDLAQRAGMPMPKLYVTPDAQPNAFATGRNPRHAAVAVTRGILDVLSWDELKGVLAHEMSHVGNRDILISSVAAAIALGIVLIANMLQWFAIFGGSREDGNNPFALIAMAILAPIAAGFLQMALSRSREYEADRTGARLLGDGEPLARALEKIDAGAKQVPMKIDPAHAQAYIVNPLQAQARGSQGANMSKWFSSHPPTAERISRLRNGEWRR